MTARFAGTYGLLATACFTVALLYFAKLYPGYTHATKAISELGALGAPHMHQWNILGFLLPGVLLAFHGWGVGAAAHNKVAGALFCLGGLSFAATAMPADMSNYYAATSQVHIGASLAGFAFWLTGSLNLTLTRKSGSTLLSRVTAASLWLSAIAGAIRFSGLVFPGTGQRLAFAAFFAWVLATALVLMFDGRLAKSNQPVPD